MMRFPRINNAAIDDVPVLTTYRSASGVVALEIREIGGAQHDSLGIFMPGKLHGRLKRAVDAFNLEMAREDTPEGASFSESLETSLSKTVVVDEQSR